MESTSNAGRTHGTWNKGKQVGQKSPLRLKEIRAIRERLQLAERSELAILNAAIDSKVRGCDLVKLRVNDVCHGDWVSARTTLMRQNMHRPDKCEIPEGTREIVASWIRKARRVTADHLFLSRQHQSPRGQRKRFGFALIA